VASHRQSLTAGARDPIAARSSTAGPQWGSRCSWGQVPHRPCATDHRVRRIHRGSFRPHQSRSRTTRRRRRPRARRPPSVLELLIPRSCDGDHSGDGSTALRLGSAPSHQRGPPPSARPGRLLQVPASHLPRLLPRLHESPPPTCASSRGGDAFPLPFPFRLLQPICSSIVYWWICSIGF
jgi:hypothetical protein